MYDHALSKMHRPIILNFETKILFLLKIHLYHFLMLENQQAYFTCFFKDFV